MAAKAGASMISPFVGRLDDIQADSGMQVIAQIKEIFENYDIATEILVASIRNPTPRARIRPDRGRHRDHAPGGAVRAWPSTR